MKAVWNGAVVAESDNTIVMEGNHYFPPESIQREYFKDSERYTVCPWKGRASYYNVVVDGKVSDGGAWYYPAPSAAAKKISGYIAFWRGVKVQP
jgi:uncharacterized protein (DUF427 family)